MTIELREIAEGDEVRLRDHDGNLITARARFDTKQDSLYVVIFGTRIYFARRTAAGWRRSSKIKVVAHQPALDGLTS